MTDDELNAAWSREHAGLTEWLAEYMRACGLPTRHAKYLAEKALIYCKGGALSGAYQPPERV